MKPRSALVTAGLALLAFTGSLRAQNAQLSGLVKDPSAAVVPNADITAINADTGVKRTTKSNVQGNYSLPQLQPGTYQVSVQAPGFQTAVRDGIKLDVAQNARLDFQLQLGSREQTITVSGGAPLLNTEDASVSTVVDRQFVENIPLNGRSFQSLIALTPGTVAVPGAATGRIGEFSVNGQRTEANYYTVDGVAANTGSFAATNPLGVSGNVPGETALGTTQSLVSLDALQEFRIQTSSYSAEYGRTPGGQVSLITRSGTNDWHGSAFDYLRNDVFDANNWFNNANRLSKTKERQNDFGGTLGGPVLLPHYNGRDRTFFFFSYEGLRLSTPQPAKTTFVPDMAMRQNAPDGLHRYLNTFPIPNGPENGSTGMAQFVAAFSTPGTINATSIRIDHSLGNKLTVFGRYSDSPSRTVSRATVTSDASLANLNNTSAVVRTLTVGATNVFNSLLTNELRFNLTWNRQESLATVDSFGGAVPLSIKDITDANGQPTPDVDSFTILLNFGGSARNTLRDFKTPQRQLNIVDFLSYSLGRHAIKFGVDYRRLANPLTVPTLSETGTFTSSAQVQQNLLSATGGSVQSQATVPIEPVYSNLSLFGQDEWRATRRLSLSFGLRWELNPPPTDAFGNPPYTLDQIANLATAAVAPKGTPLWKTTYGNLAPRLGAVYQLRQTTGRETVIRGGFGVFYDFGNTFASQGYAVGVGVGVTKIPGSVAFPFTAAQLILPAPSVAPPYNATVTAFDPHLQLPYTLEWNVALEQALGRGQALTFSYVGEAGRRLLLARAVRPAAMGNPNFSSTGQLILTTNLSTSDYDALQIQYQRRLSHGLQALVSYTWAHSIDETSTNITSVQLLRANSNFDIRHNFQAAVTYDIPGVYKNAFAGALLRHWGLDTRIISNSALPFDVNGGSIFDSAGTFQQLRADLVPGQPIYINDPTAPGGRLVNFSAFTIPTAAETAAGQFGNAPRNFLLGFPVWQVDLALRREFPIYERLRFQFRAEAFNLFNHPIFGAIQNSLTTGAAQFGKATGSLNNQLGGLNALYQPGGPRSFQFALKLIF